MKTSENKYLRIYYSIINNARSRGLDRKKLKKTIGYIEIHHIIPKCLGGKDSSSNLVALTFKEHYVCHHLLCAIFKNNYLIRQAYYFMSHIEITEGGKRVRKRVSAKMIEEFKKFAKDHKKPISEETKNKLRMLNSGKNNPNYGKKRSKESLEKSSKSLKEYYKNVPKEKEELRRKHLSEKLKGLPKNKEGIEKMKLTKIMAEYKQSQSTIEKKSISLKGHKGVSDEMKLNMAERYGFAIEYHDEFNNTNYTFPSISSAVKYLRENNILDRSFKYIKRSCEKEINGFKFLREENIMIQRKVLAPNGIIYDSLSKCAREFNTSRASLLLWINEYPHKGFKFID